jgi:hypothetical protein
MNKRTFISAVFLAAIVLLLPIMGAASTFGACDNFGQGWKITWGPFGGTFPGTYLVSGCRDCSASLGCGGPLPLDGTVVMHGSSKIWSVVAYSPVGSSCLSSQWSGLQAGTVMAGTVNGNVSNNSGPFSTFTLTLGSPCTATKTLIDPTTHPSPTIWQPVQ